MIRSLLQKVFSIGTLGMVLSIPSFAQQKPNILVLWGDDIGISNISAYSDGLMGYETPNIDRIANAGLGVWREGFDKLRMAKIFDMYADPFERGDESLLYDNGL